MILLFAVNNALQLIPTRNDIYDRVRQEQRSNGDYLAYGVQRWASQIYQSLLVIRNTPFVQALEPQQTQAYFDALQRAYPARQFALYNRDGYLVAATASLPRQTKAMRHALLKRSDFQRSINGEFIYEIGQSILSGKTCLLMRAPVYTSGETHVDPLLNTFLNQVGDDGQSTQSSRLSLPKPLVDKALSPPQPNKNEAVGVITFCLPLEQLDRDSGLVALYRNMNPSMLSRKEVDGQSFSLKTLPRQGSVFLMLTNDGHLLFPHLIDTPSWLLTPLQIQGSPWGAFVEQALKSTYHTVFRDLWLNHRRYLLTTRKVDPVWSIALVVDKDSAFREPDRLLWVLIANEMLVLLIAALVINVTCTQAAKPIHSAGLAIRRLASGEFDVDLPLTRRDEIGSLYRDISETAKKLQHFLQQQTTYLITRKQIETGRAIQKSFLVDTLPLSPYASIAASFNPAQEVAGDWYDSIEVNGVLYVVVADVCDKGVGAALFMSVFRTLLRYQILRAEAESLTDSGHLASVVSLVNDYMAENHADSVMFATLFVAQLTPAASELAYVCAGHEMPYLLRQQPGSPLERLDVTGPAIGVFTGASFSVKHIAIRSGDLLFAYTDGLTDARSPDGSVWGLENLESQLQLLHAQHADASEVVDHLLSVVKAHMDEAEPFDDLTMLALKVI